jgi:hypothetical protein
MFSGSVGEDRSLPGGKRTRGVHNLYSDMLRIYRGPYLQEMAGRLLSAARDVLTNGQDEFVLVRGGAVEVGEGALVMLTPPDLHRASLTALLAQRGARFLGDGVLELDPVLRRIHPSPFPPLLYEADLELFPSMRDQLVRRRKRDDREREILLPPRPVSVEDLQAERGRDPAPVRWIVFPDFDLGAETSLEPAGGSQALFRFIEAVLNLHVWRDRGLLLARELLEDGAVSRLVVGSIPEAADLLMETAPSLMEEVRA